LVGLTSGIDWTVWSSADSGAASASVRRRVSAKRRASGARSLSAGATFREIGLIPSLPIASAPLTMNGASPAKLPNPAAAVTRSFSARAARFCQQ